MKLSKQKQIDWLYERICEYDRYNDLKDMTFLDDIKKDKKYVERHFDISILRLHNPVTKTNYPVIKRKTNQKQRGFK